MPSGELTKKGCASCAEEDPAVGYLTCPMPALPACPNHCLKTVSMSGLHASTQHIVELLRAEQLLLMRQSKAYHPPAPNAA